MNYLSVCSGIEAATVGWHLLGWQAVAFSEIEPFPCAALAHHYPTVPNFGDMTKFKEWPDAAVDVFVGGTPCQSFSVAGLRKGLADPRGNLMLTYLAIAAKYRPRWLVWENVPGVLSSNGGNDFASLLRGLGECGYGFAYRILDAQYFGVPQRRRRVFVVGHLGSWQRAAAVLFERHSLQEHPAPRREAGKRVAPPIAGCSNGGGANGPGRDVDSTDSILIGGIDYENNGHGPTGPTGPLLKGSPTGGGRPLPAIVMSTGQAGAEIGIGIGTTLNCNHEAPIVTHSLRGEGFDASEDGTGRGTPLVPVAYSMITANTGANGLGVAAEVAPTLDRAQPCAVALNIYGGNKRADRPEGGFYVKKEETSKTLDSATGLNPTCSQGGTAVMSAMQVRRLTPQECERLQGFPDEYTQVPYRNKPAADGPRYKALGNSMAVPVMAWIGKRIQQVESI